MPESIKKQVKTNPVQKDFIQKGPLLYEGKGKKIFSLNQQTIGPAMKQAGIRKLLGPATKPMVNPSDLVILFFKDDLTAYQAKKRGSFPGKGEICQSLSALIFKYLYKKGLPNHFIKTLNPREMLCLKTQIIPLEVVIRNRLAGSTAHRLGLKEGRVLKSPLLEFYYKKDELEDPFISEEQIVSLDLISDSQLLKAIKKQAYLINKALQKFFLKSGLELVDFKMEFGLFKKQLLLADEISPDSCRIWDQKTGERLDKDRFRKDWGKVEESYQQIAKRLTEFSNIPLDKGAGG